MEGIAPFHVMDIPDLLETRKTELRFRRDFLLPALRDLSFKFPVTPQGAFYPYTDCGRFTSDSHVFADQLLAHAEIAATPRLDFGSHHATRHLRFAYTQALTTAN